MIREEESELRNQVAQQMIQFRKERVMKAENALCKG